MKKIMVLVATLLAAVMANASEAPQNLSGSTVVQGVVADASGAVIPGAQVTLSNPITGFRAETTTDAQGAFNFRKVSFGAYHLKATAKGFNAADQNLDLHSSVPVNLQLALPIAASQTVVNVEASDANEIAVESTPTAHTDLNAGTISKLPVATNSTGLSSVIQQSAPGVAADSNGMFHPQGEHSDTSFVIDNQPITDQQSRTFSNQISLNTIDSMEAISGVAPAEFGDKASLVVRTNTKSGLGITQPHGDLALSYGTFGTSSGSFDLGVGNKKFGNFVAIDGLNSGRFLDTPEFLPIHAHGNAWSFFDRVDYQLTDRDSFHMNLSAARSWFQIPNQYDQQATLQDQRQQQYSWNVAPGYTHQFNNATLLTANAYLRQDQVEYYPSNNLYFDQAANIFSDQTARFGQQRRLTNVGGKADISYVKGIHNLKGGVQIQQTPLTEFFELGLTDPALGSPYNLALGETPFTFRGHTDIKQEAAYIQDSMKLKNLTLMLGLRGDNYNGLSTDYQLQPRVGASYLLSKTNTVARFSYGRFMLTPYNENLILSSSVGEGGLGSTGVPHPLIPAVRNHFETGLQQTFGRYVQVDASYFWKYTNDDFDFDVLFNTPLAFPIQWQKSKIDGVSVRVSMPVMHGWSAYSVMGHTRARFFGPEVGGILFNSTPESGPFRIDHDQAFQQSTHVQYQFGKKLPWVGMTWSYESGEVAGAITSLEATLPPTPGQPVLPGQQVLTPDQQVQMGLHCGNVYATRTTPIVACAPGQLGSTRLNVPTLGTFNPDKNPTRVAPRNTFDLAIGTDNLFGGDHKKVSLKLTVANLTNEVALYNFLSTFSGTHFLAPRMFTGEVGFHF